MDYSISISLKFCVEFKAMTIGVPQISRSRGQKVKVTAWHNVCKNRKIVNNSATDC